MIKNTVRNASIRYYTFKKKNENKEENDLVKYIDTLEVKISLDSLENYKAKI